MLFLFSPTGRAKHTPSQRAEANRIKNCRRFCYATQQAHYFLATHYQIEWGCRHEYRQPKIKRIEAAIVFG
jgi:hypothetical protein